MAKDTFGEGIKRKAVDWEGYSSLSEFKIFEILL